MNHIVVMVLCKNEKCETTLFETSTLHIKRRRWLLTDSGKKVTRDWTIIAPGTGMTKDLAAFFKEAIDRSNGQRHTV